MLNGSYKNERSTSTTASTGQKSYAHVIMKFSLPRPLVCLCLKTNLSSNHTAIKNSVAGTRIKLKSKSMGVYPSNLISVRLLIQLRTLLVGFQRYPLASYVSYLLSRSEEHTSELQSRPHLVCRLLLEKKKK